MRIGRKSSKPDPWTESDPVLAKALWQMKYYANRRNRDKVYYVVSEVLILLITAATTLAAAFKASPWITAVLAATSLIVAGQMRIFNWHDSWLAMASAWAELEVAVNEYRLRSLGESHPHIQEELMKQINDIISSDVKAWAARRRAVAGKDEDSS